MSLFRELAAESIKYQTSKMANGSDGKNTAANLIKVAIGVVGIVAVIVIILGGITYATSQGDAQKVAKGKNTIIGGVVGLVIAVLAFAITSFVAGSV